MGLIFGILFFSFLLGIVLIFKIELHGFCVEHQRYMHIAIVLVPLLLNILYLSSFLIPFTTYCKMLLVTKKEHNKNIA